MFIGQPEEQAIGQSTFVPSQVTEPPHNGSPKSPMGAGRQVPGDAERSQRSQDPEHAVPQQTPFAQMPEVHWKAALHICPVGRVARQLP